MIVFIQDFLRHCMMAVLNAGQCAIRRHYAFCSRRWSAAQQHPSVWCMRGDVCNEFVGYALMARAERNSSTPAAVTALISTTCAAPALSRKRLARCVLAVRRSVLVATPITVRLNMRAKPGGNADVARVASCRINQYFQNKLYDYNIILYNFFQILYDYKDCFCLWCYYVSNSCAGRWIMDYMHELASIALKSVDSKKFTIEDGHEMTITPAGDGKTMRINIDDGVSYKTKGANDFIKKIEEILTNRGVTG